MTAMVMAAAFVVIDSVCWFSVEAVFVVGVLGVCM